MNFKGNIFYYEGSCSQNIQPCERNNEIVTLKLENKQQLIQSDIVGHTPPISQPTAV